MPHYASLPSSISIAEMERSDGASALLLCSNGCREPAQLFEIFYLNEAVYASNTRIHQSLQKVIYLR